MERIWNEGAAPQLNGQIMDELEEILRRLGDAENVIETFIQYRLNDRSICSEWLYGYLNGS